MARPFRLIRTMDDIRPSIEDALDDAVNAPIRHLPGSPRLQGGITASGSTINVGDERDAILTSAVARYARTWQRAAWDYVEAIGEIRYGFGALASAGGRAVLCGAILEDPTKPPVTLTAIKDSDPTFGKVGGRTREVMSRANDMVAELGRQLITTALYNICVAGEFYLINLDNQWRILSSEELVPVGVTGEVLSPIQLSRRNAPKVNYWAVKQDRALPPVALPQDVYLARIWRAHPRWQMEPSSSMLGVLDQCEELLLLDQMFRASTRSRLFAGALFIPDGVDSPGEENTLESDLTTAALTSISKEDAAYGVVPMILTGPGEASDQIRHFMLSRGITEPDVQLLDRVLDRILTGIDLPKEFVKGLGSAKYANSVVIEEGMYRMHIAPLLELICDALTKVYLRPRLIKEGYAEAIVNRMVVTFDPVNIVTRPDQGQAANDGYDRKTLSGAAWRAARGFSEADAPTGDEQFQRWQREKGIIPPDAAAAYVEFLGGPGLKAARKYVAQINTENPPAPMADGGQPGVGAGANQATGPEAQAPTEPGTPSTPLPPELTEILSPTAEKSTAPRARSNVPGGDRRPGEMLPPAP